MLDLDKLECISSDINLHDYLTFYNNIKSSMDSPEWLGDWTEEELTNMLVNGGKIWLFKQGQDFVCSLMFMPAPDHILKKFGIFKNCKIAECGPVMVSPKYRGNGLQQQMLDFLDKFCLENNFKYIMTTIHPDNTISINNFVKCGYSYISSHNLKRGLRDLFLKNLETDMTKFIFLEGLPGVGKTTLLNLIKAKNLENFHFADEIVNEKILKNQSMTELDFIDNENLKLDMFKDGTIIFDRGPISLLSYSQAKAIIDPHYDPQQALKWFEETQKIFNSNTLVYYLFNDNNFSITSRDLKSPYGSIPNQVLLKSITEFNIKKYCPNFIFKNYNKKNVDEVIDEIVN